MLSYTASDLPPATHDSGSHSTGTAPAAIVEEMGVTCPRATIENAFLSVVLSNSAFTSDTIIRRAEGSLEIKDESNSDENFGGAGLHGSWGLFLPNETSFHPSASSSACTADEQLPANTTAELESEAAGRTKATGDTASAVKSSKGSTRMFTVPSPSSSDNTESTRSLKKLSSSTTSSIAYSYHRPYETPTHVEKFPGPALYGLDGYDMDSDSDEQLSRNTYESECQFWQHTGDCQTTTTPPPPPTGPMFVSPLVSWELLSEQERERLQAMVTATYPEWSRHGPLPPAFHHPPGPLLHGGPGAEEEEEEAHEDLEVVKFMVEKFLRRREDGLESPSAALVRRRNFRTSEKDRVQPRKGQPASG